MNNLRQDFLNQSIESIENLTIRLMNEIEPADFSENFRREAFRTLHTIKGTAQTFGFPAAGSLAHELENLLSTEKNRQSVEQEDYKEENYKSFFSDGLRLLKQTFEQKDFEIPAAFAEKIRRAAPPANDSETFLADVPRQIISQLSSREKNVVDSALRSGKNLFSLEVGFNLTDFAEGLTAFREVLNEKCEIVATLPGAKSNVSGKIGFQILLTTSEIALEIEKIAESHRAEIVFQFARQTFSDDLRGIVEQVRAHGEQLAKRLGKNVKFEILIEARIEKQKLQPLVLKLIFDALLHLIRNAVDHAVETGEERAANGKPARATIKIRFSKKENNLLLSVSDDGRGIDAEKIKAKAIEKKIIAEADNLPEQALLDLIFEPEFSTAERLTEISGRGVGLDAVKHSIEKHGGRITIENRRGSGTTFEISLPGEK